MNLCGSLTVMMSVFYRLFIMSVIYSSIFRLIILYGIVVKMQPTLIQLTTVLYYSTRFYLL